MKIIDRWNEFMGPKDERLAAESNRCAAVGYTILIIGSALCLYYGIMLNQVAETTGHPLLTPLGQSVFPVDTALLIIILASGLISTYLQVRSGTFDTHTRIAQADRIPWDYVALVSHSVRPRAGRHNDGHAHSRGSADRRRRERDLGRRHRHRGRLLHSGVLFGLRPVCRHVPQRHRPPSPAGARAGRVAGAHSRERTPDSALATRQALRHGAHCARANSRMVRSMGSMRATATASSRQIRMVPPR